MHPQIWGVVGPLARCILALPALTDSNSKKTQQMAPNSSASFTWYQRV